MARKRAAEATPEPAQGAAKPVWANRIVGHGVEVPDQLLAHPYNWHVHPKAQQDAMATALDTVGWVQDVIVNQRTGHVLDGHMRVSLAISREEPEVPVVYVDLSPEEEELVLSTLDPMAGMAVSDVKLLAQLRESVVQAFDLPTGSLREMLGGGARPQALLTPESQADPALLADFAERARQRGEGLVGLTCPYCGHDFEKLQAELLA